MRARRKRVERARHRDHHGLDGIFGRLIVEDGEDADLVALEGAAQIEFLQALQAGQHEEVRLDHGVVDVAPGLLLLPLGEFCRGGIGFLAPRQLDLDRAGRRGPFGAVGVAGLLRHQLGGDAEPHAGAGIGDDLPADAFLLSPGGVGQDAALLRIEHAGRLAAAGLLEFLDRLDHALADVAGDRAVILPDPGEVRLQRQPLGLRHRVGRVLRLLQRGTDRYRGDRFRLGARRGRRRQLRLRGGPETQNRGRDHQCCRKHRSHDKSRRMPEWSMGALIDVAPIKHICLVGNNRAPVQGLISPHPEEAAERRLEGWPRASMVRDARSALLTMRMIGAMRKETRPC